MNPIAKRLSAVWAAGLIAALAGAAAANAQTPAPGSTEAGSEIAYLTFTGSYLAGRSAASGHDYDAAARFYIEALESDPQNPTLLRETFGFVLANGDFEKALELADRVIAVSPQSGYAHLMVGIDALKAGDHEKARASLANAGQGALDILVRAVATAWIDLKEGKADEAIKRVEALEGPNWYEIFKTYHGALIASAAGKTDLAMAKIGAAREIDASAFKIAESAARIYFLAGEREKAVEALDGYANGTRKHPIIEKLRADIAESRTVAPTPSLPTEGVVELLYGIGTALGNDGGRELAAMYLQLAHHIDPEADLVNLALGDLFQATRKDERAIDAYERVMAGSPMRRQAQLQSAISLNALERTDEAIDHVSAIIEEDPSDLTAVATLSSILRVHKRFGEAAEVLSKGIATISEPTVEHWRLYYVRGISHERTKQWPLAEADFKMALKLHPDQPDVLNYLGYSWVDMNLNLDEALEMIRTAVSLRPDDGYIVDSLGWAYYRLGRYEEAVEQLQRAVELMPEDPVVNDHLGDAYWRVGRKLEARFQWSHARDLEPEPDDLKAILEKLANGLPDPSGPRLAEGEKNTAVDVAGVAGPAVAGPAGDKPAASTSTATTATVVRGDSLWVLAQRAYGDGNLYRLIFDANRDQIRNPDLILPGAVLDIPARPAANP